MAIIFDTKKFKRRYKNIKLGKEKYSLRISLYISLFTALFINGFNYLIFDEKEIKALILKFTFYFIFLFIVNYLFYKSQWKPFVNDYNDSLEYWEKHDPAFFEGEKYEKIE